MRAIGVDLYNQTITGGVAMTIRAKVGDNDHTPCVICPAVGLHQSAKLWHGYEPISLTNSNGGQVMPTISADEYKMSQRQKDNGGGYVLHRFEEHKAK